MHGLVQSRSACQALLKHNALLFCSGRSGGVCSGVVFPNVCSHFGQCVCRLIRGDGNVRNGR